MIIFLLCLILLVLLIPIIMRILAYLISNPDLAKGIWYFMKGAFMLLLCVVGTIAGIGAIIAMIIGLKQI